MGNVFKLNFFNLIMKKKFIFIIFFILFSFFEVFSQNIVLVENEDYKVEIEDKVDIILYGDLEKTYELIVTNKKDNNQVITLSPKTYVGWEHQVFPKSIIVPKNSQKSINLVYTFKEDFEQYILKEKSENYILLEVLEVEKGSFEFEVEVIGNIKETINLNLFIDKDYFKNLEFNPILKTSHISPEKDLVFELFGADINKRDDMKFSVLLNNIKLDDFYKSKDLGLSNYAYFFKIPNTIESNKEYELKIILYYEEDLAEPRTFKTNIFINEFKNIITKDVSNETFSFWENRKVLIENLGNVKDTHKEYVNASNIEKMFLTSNYEIKKDDNGYYFEVEINPNQKVYLDYKFEYTLLTTIIIIILILVALRFYYFLKVPLDLEVGIDDINKTQGEGVGSFKLKIKIENFKPKTFQKVYVVVKLPIYLKIFENGFLIQEPDKLLKGKNFYKLVWSLENVRKFDTRYIGFLVANELKVLADINIPPVEVQILENEKLVSYYLKIPKIKYE